jgi:hypothetical protein
VDAVHAGGGGVGQAYPTSGGQVKHLSRPPDLARVLWQAFPARLKLHDGGMLLRSASGDFKSPKLQSRIPGRSCHESSRSRWHSARILPLLSELGRQRRPDLRSGCISKSRHRASQKAHIPNSRQLGFVSLIFRSMTSPSKWSCSWETLTHGQRAAAPHSPSYSGNEYT